PGRVAAPWRRSRWRWSPRDQPADDAYRVAREPGGVDPPHREGLLLLQVPPELPEPAHRPASANARQTAWTASRSLSYSPSAMPRTTAATDRRNGSRSRARAHWAASAPGLICSSIGTSVPPDSSDS